MRSLLQRVVARRLARRNLIAGSWGLGLVTRHRGRRTVIDSGPKICLWNIKRRVLLYKRLSTSNSPHHPSPRPLIFVIAIGVTISRCLLMMWRNWSSIMTRCRAPTIRIRRIVVYNMIRSDTVSLSGYWFPLRIADWRTTASPRSSGSSGCRPVISVLRSLAIRRSLAGR